MEHREGLDIATEEGTDDLTDAPRPEVLQVEVTCTMLIRSEDGETATRVSVRDRMSADMLKEAEGFGFQQLCNTVRRRAVHAANIRGALAEKLFGRKPR